MNANEKVELEALRDNQAELAGFKMGVLTVGLNKNPFKNGTWRHALWKKGYDEGQHEKELIALTQNTGGVNDLSW